MRVLLVLSAFLYTVWGLAPLVSQTETVDRVENGVEQRSYLVMFNKKAPVFGENKQKLQGWLKETFSIEPEHVQHAYEITENFRGYAVWATPEIRDAILADEGTEYIEEDSVVRAFAPFTARADWGQVRETQKGARNLATVPANLYNTSYPAAGNATESWDWTTAVYNGYKPINNGNGSFIWVVDTGLLRGHQEFYRQGSTTTRVTRWQDYVTTGGDASDCNGHGTHCAGSAAGLYRGLAWGAELGAIRVLSCAGSGTNANVIAGFNYVSSNQVSGRTNIMSVSLGGGFSQTSNNAVTNAANNGVVAVVAAGNDNNANACNVSPASTPEAVTVGASDRTDARASFSNSGSCLDVFAPGVSIHSGWYTGNTVYNTISGTSMATPLTAGAIALYATRQGIVRYAAVKTAISNFGTRGVVTGTLLAGTPNIMINANWD